jgi:hypothetical protein
MVTCKDLATRGNKGYTKSYNLERVVLGKKILNPTNTRML